MFVFSSVVIDLINAGAMLIATRARFGLVASLLPYRLKQSMRVFARDACIKSGRFDHRWLGIESAEFSVITNPCQNCPEYWDVFDPL